MSQLWPPLKAPALGSQGGNNGPACEVLTGASSLSTGYYPGNMLADCVCVYIYIYTCPMYMSLEGFLQKPNKTL